MAQQDIKAPIPLGRDIYETWWEVEKSLRKLDRIFIKVEKFHGRKFTDPEHHERREARMLSRKRDREFNNFTYFFGGHTEEEQMYRDYYETDLEQFPEIEAEEDAEDEARLIQGGEFDTNRFQFVETNLREELHENLEDIVEDKIFKFKYRRPTDNGETFDRRESRMISRFMQRV